VISRLVEEDSERYAALSIAEAACGATAGMWLFTVAVTVLISMA
jgi:hypothetical protein